MIYFVVLYIFLLGLWLARSSVDIFSPITIVIAFIFSIALSIFFDKTFVEGTFLDYFLILTALAALLLIPFITSKRRHRSFKILMTNEKLSSYTYSSQQLILIYSMFFVSLFTYYYIEFYSQRVICLVCLEWSGEIKNLNIEKAHRLGKDSKFQILASQLCVFGALIFHHSSTAISKRTKRLALFISTIPIALAVMKTSKSDLFFIAITYGAFLYYSRIGLSKIARKKLVICALLLLAIFVLSINLRVTSLGGDYGELVAFKNSRVSTIEAPLYGYTAGSIDNLILFLQKNAYPVLNTNFGSSALRPIFSILLMGDEADKMLIGEALHTLGPGATVGSYMRSLAHEGGILWLFAISILYGLVISALYSKFIKSGNAIHLAMYSLLLIPWFMLPFQNLFANLNIWVGIFLLAALSSLNNDSSPGRKSW